MYQRSILVLTLLTVILVIVPMHASAQSENMMATVETKSGNFVIEFFPDVAPSHVNNFITLSQDGFYDGTVFHRVINGFMIQGGDPNTKDPELISLWGTGGPDHSVDAEFNDISHERGIVSMARSSNPNSAGSQFFIVHEDASFLDGQYTVFGRIVGDESFTTLDNIANMDTLPSDVPVDWQNTEIISITFEENMMSEEMNDGGGCLIATAAFGSEMAPQVQSLREVRDNIILETESGKTFMTSFNHVYYAFSPAMADLERKDPMVRDTVRAVITPMIASLTIFENIEINSEVDVITYGVLVILANIIMYVGTPLIALYILKQYLSRMSKNKKYITA